MVSVNLVSSEGTLNHMLKSQRTCCSRQYERPKQGQLSEVTYIKRARPKKTDCLSPKTPKFKDEATRRRRPERGVTGATEGRLHPRLKACSIRTTGSFPVPRTPGTQDVKGFSLFTQLWGRTALPKHEQNYWQPYSQPH